VKIVTGDNDRTARAVCRELQMPVGDVLTGAQIATMDDTQLGPALKTANIFARVTPEQKARIIKLRTISPLSLPIIKSTTAPCASRCGGRSARRRTTGGGLLRVTPRLRPSLHSRVGSQRVDDRSSPM